ncbi:MAG: hypothetical protein ABIG20_02555 [archaeon]
MKIKFSPVNLFILLTLLAFAIFLVWAVWPDTTPRETSDYFVCNNQIVPFRANATACSAIPIYPHEDEAWTALLNSKVSYIILLMDPNGTAAYGSSVYEVQKTLISQGIPHKIAFTEPWAKKPTVPVMTTANATTKTPVILFRSDAGQTSIEVSGPVVTVTAESQKAMDAAACRIAVLILDTFYSCSIQNDPLY